MHGHGAGGVRYGQDEIWDEDFKQKKFDLGRIIERDLSHLSMNELGEIDMQRYQQMSEDDKQKEANRLKNQDRGKPFYFLLQRGRVVKTTSIDFFLNCDTMDLDEVETNEFLKKEPEPEEDDDEEDPEWNDIDIDEIKAPVPSNLAKPAQVSTKAQNLQDQDEAIISIKPKEQSIPQQTIQQQSQNVMSPNQSLNAQMNQNDQEAMFYQNLISKMNPADQFGRIDPNQAAFQQMLMQDQIAAQQLINNGGGSPPIQNNSINQQFINQQQNFNQQINADMMRFQQQQLQTQNIAGQPMMQMDPMSMFQQPGAHQDLQLGVAQQAALIQNPFSEGVNFLMSRTPNQQLESKWFYKDPSGNVRGPFTQQQMATWYDLGYFSDDLEIAYGENSMFLPLRSYKQISLSNSMGLLNPTGLIQNLLPGQQPLMSGVPLQQQQFLNPLMNPLGSGQLGQGFVPQDLQQFGNLDVQQRMLDPMLYGGNQLQLGQGMNPLMGSLNNIPFNCFQREILNLNPISKVNKDSYQPGNFMQAQLNAQMYAQGQQTLPQNGSPQQHLQNPQQIQQNLQMSYQ